MRTFIAIDLPQEVHRELARQQAAFRGLIRDARWTSPEGIHLTLKFLGEVKDAQVIEIKRALEPLAAFTPFTVEVKGFGFFPDARRPRVFWAGIDAAPDLGQLAARVEDAMAKLGFPREERSYSPHLTLARFREPKPQPALRDMVAKHTELSWGRFEVSEFFLYESKLHPQGAEYIKLARFAIDSPSREGSQPPQR